MTRMRRVPLLALSLCAIVVRCVVVFYVIFVTVLCEIAVNSLTSRHPVADIILVSCSFRR